MPHRLCDHIYDVVIEADLTESQRVELFHTISRYIVHLADGFEMRRAVLRFQLQEQYYGENKLQEKIENEWLLWRSIWDIIYRDAYDENEMQRSADFFRVELDDILFIMNNLYQEDIKAIQGLHYDPRKDFGRYNPVVLLSAIRPKIIKMVKRKMKFLFQYDQGMSLEDFVAHAELKALQGFRRYDGQCVSEKDAQYKMFNCARSWVMDTLNNPNTHDQKRVIQTEGGYQRQVLSLDSTTDNQNTLLDTLPCNETLNCIHFAEYISIIEQRCSSGVVAYVKDVIYGQSEVDPKEKGYYPRLRKKYGITKQQVREEVGTIIRDVLLTR